MKGVLFLVNKFSMIKILSFIGILGNKFVTSNEINFSRKANCTYLHSVGFFVKESYDYVKSFHCKLHDDVVPGVNL